MVRKPRKKGHYAHPYNRYKYSKNKASTYDSHPTLRRMKNYQRSATTKLFVFHEGECMWTSPPTLIYTPQYLLSPQSFHGPFRSPSFEERSKVTQGAYDGGGRDTCEHGNNRDGQSEALGNDNEDDSIDSESSDTNEATDNGDYGERAEVSNDSCDNESSEDVDNRDEAEYPYDDEKNNDETQEETEDSNIVKLSTPSSTIGGKLSQDTEHSVEQVTFTFIDKNEAFVLIKDLIDTIIDMTLVSLNGK